MAIVANTGIDWEALRVSFQYVWSTRSLQRRWRDLTASPSAGA
jgi:hypothetical protein